MITCIRETRSSAFYRNIRRISEKTQKKHRNEIDMMHCNFLVQIRELLEHNDFLTAQSRKITEFL